MAATRGDSSRFTYDFGIAIAQSTVNKVARLTGASLTLASAFYALKESAKEYVEQLKLNSLHFGGLLSTMKAVEQAQNRIILGQSKFSVEDQLTGMKRLAAVGVDMKENLDWISKAAHATGKSMSEFSGIVASAIGGNMQGLVDMGMLTQRATRMFEKYPANTIMRQQAMLNFMKTHKGLQQAIKNDFETIKDQMLRIKTTWKSLVKAIVGEPTDPNSLYGQVRASLKLVAESMARSATTLKRFGYMTGQVLGWVIKQVGYLVTWLGRQVSNLLGKIWTITDNFKEQTKSFIVWLEFWKLKIVDFFKEYGHAIMTVIKWLLIFKVAKMALMITKPILTSIKAGVNWMYRLIYCIWDTCRHLGILKGLWFFIVDSLPNSVWKVIKLISSIGRAIFSAFTASNPIGWIILVIAAFVTLYLKCEKFRKLANRIFEMFAEYWRLLWNSLNYLYVQVRIGLIKFGEWFTEKIWTPIKKFFTLAGDWIAGMWDKFKDTTVGQWIDKWIVQPIKKVYDWVVEIWKKLSGFVKGGISTVTNFLRGANNNIVSATEAAASQYGIKTATWGSEVHIDDNWVNKGKQKPSVTPVVNPLTPVGGNTNNTRTTNVNVSNGAVQIVVQKGDNIDEATLARKIKDELKDMNRNVRGGM